MRRSVVVLMLGVFAVCCLAPKASAIPNFKREFQKLYVKPDTDEEFAKLVKSNKTGCYLCHQGKNRKHRNPYGAELSKLLDKKKDAKDVKKIIASLRKVEKIHTDPDDEKSPTYGDLIKENKFPGGPLEEVLKEPEEDAEKTPNP